jgi:gluconate 5-dehydrogenase
MISNLFSLESKTALITGSTRGIGNTLAQGLAAAGSRVILNGRDKNTLNKTVAELSAKGYQVFGSAFDIQEEKNIQNQINYIENEIGSLDILINNAGIQIRSPLESFSAEDWHKIININLTGAFLTSKAVVQGMIKRRSGKIINICSIQSELARPTIAPYTASKGGLKLLTQGMATDWGKHNIQVNGIAPGYFKTELTKSLYEDKKFDAWLCSRVPANRWGDPGELIGAAIFLASKASDYINGHVIFVDGGLRACV